MRELREARGYSIRQLANRSEVTPEMVSRAERRRKTPSLETLARVCAGLGVSVAEFFAGSASDGALAGGEVQQTLPKVVRKLMVDDAEPGFSLRAQEHLLDAIRSIERSMEAQREGGSQRRRTKKQ